MAVNAAAIHEFFDRYGWRYEFEQESATWHTGFRGDSSNFNIFVHLTESWLYFTICPFVNAPAEPECERKLHAYLLRLNNAINLAKFAVDADGDVVLSVELPIENLDYSEFADGLNAISFYADAHYVEILNTAQDAAYEPSFGQTVMQAAAVDGEEEDDEDEDGEESDEKSRAN